MWVLHVQAYVNKYCGLQTSLIDIIVNVKKRLFQMLLQILVITMSISDVTANTKNTYS